MNTLIYSMPVLADTAGTMTSMLATFGKIGGALVAAALIFSLVKDAWGYIKGTGQNSIGKIVGKVIFLIVMIGLIVLAVNYESSFSKTGKNIGDKGIKVVDDFSNDLTK